RFEKYNLSLVIFKRATRATPFCCLDMFKRKRLTLHWKDKKTIVIDAFLFKQAVQLTIPQKIVQKDDISKHGLVKAYENTANQYMQEIGRASCRERIDI